MNLDEQTIQQRLDTGHHPYIARLGETPAGYGWVASHEASIGELDLEFVLPSNNRYLWDYVTLPTFRGHGVYPHLLQTILRQELQAADRFWIIYAPENGASEAGIRKAGFTPVDELSFLAEGGAGMIPLVSDIRASLGSDLLHIPLLQKQAQHRLFPCWRCAAMKQRADCWPLRSLSSSLRSHCTCLKKGNNACILS
jgi:GNAT superfamily N-acetyltransferase